MPALKPSRTTPGVALALPRVTDADTQRALDRVALAIWQIQSQLGRISNDTGIFTATEAGLVPAAGVGVTRFLRQDGTFALPSGAAVADADYGDVIVTGGGTVWTVDSLPESRIINLVADLAAKVATSTTITTATPLKINGSASGDLSSPPTFSIILFTSSLAGAVPASGGGTTNFLRADGSWAPPTGPAQPRYDTVIDQTGSPISFGSAYDQWNVGTLGQNTLIKYVTDGSPTGSNSRAVRGLLGGADGLVATFMNMANNVNGTALFQHEDGAGGSNAFHNAGGAAISGNTMGCITYRYSDGFWRHLEGTQ